MGVCGCVNVWAMVRDVCRNGQKWAERAGSKQLFAPGPAEQTGALRNFVCRDQVVARHVLAAALAPLNTR